MSSNTTDFSSQAAEAPDAKRWGGWNGAIAQGAAIILSGVSAGELNGPSGGSYRMPSYGGSAPISRPYRY
jgi:hypothetical protein